MLLSSDLPLAFGYAANASLCAGRRLHHPLKLSYLHNESRGGVTPIGGRVYMCL